MLFESLKDIDSVFGFDHAGYSYDLLPAGLRLQSLGRPTGDPAPVQYGEVPSERSHELRTSRLKVVDAGCDAFRSDLERFFVIKKGHSHGWPRYVATVWMWFRKGMETNHLETLNGGS